jgi:hypothetical protein
MPAPVVAGRPPRWPRGARALRAFVCGAALAAGWGGCGGGDEADPYRRYVPEPAEARRAVETALSAWRDAPDPLPESLDTPAVRFVDKQRKAGQRLRRFEVLGESDAETARQLTVRLVLERPEEVLLVRYNVFGREPYWVFRLEDYEQFSHWEHEMKEAPPTAEGP